MYLVRVWRPVAPTELVATLPAFAPDVRSCSAGVRPDRLALGPRASPGRRAGGRPRVRPAPGQSAL